MQKNLVVSVRRMRAIASASVKQAASCLAIFLSLGAVPAGAADTLDNPDRLIDLTLEELSNLEVISAARRPQKLREAASALYVITQQDIRRAGATSIPEALRLAPNLSVARAASNQYAISARGFNSTTANKLLVLIDGRSVYTPLFSGVFWDVQDTLMEDIDRIEVTSGPGATMPAYALVRQPASQCLADRDWNEHSRLAALNQQSQMFIFFGHDRLQLLGRFDRRTVCRHDHVTRFDACAGRRPGRLLHDYAGR
jgi:hypothetical protein